MILIPIGIQCTAATFKKNINKTSATLPFDWMLSTPKFVFEILVLLLEKNIDIIELVKTHFLFCHDIKKANLVGNIEHYHVSENGHALYNKNGNAIFPHDEMSFDTLFKYVRRFERLKDLILNSQEELCFIYTSQSSLTNGNFTINGKNVIKDVYHYLSMIYNLIGKYRTNYKMVVFDCIKIENRSLLNKNIILCELNQCNSWPEILSQMNNYVHLFN